MAWTSCIPSVPAPLLRHFSVAGTTRAWPAGVTDESGPPFVAGFSSPGSVSGSSCPALGVDACDGVSAVGDVALELVELDGEEETEEAVGVPADGDVVVPSTGSGPAGSVALLVFFSVVALTSSAIVISTAVAATAASTTSFFERLVRPEARRACGSVVADFGRSAAESAADASRVLRPEFGSGFEFEARARFGSGFEIGSGCEPGSCFELGSGFAAVAGASPAAARAAGGVVE